MSRPRPSSRVLRDSTQAVHISCFSRVKVGISVCYKRHCVNSRRFGAVIWYVIMWTRCLIILSNFCCALLYNYLFLLYLMILVSFGSEEMGELSWVAIMKWICPRVLTAVLLRIQVFWEVFFNTVISNQKTSNCFLRANVLLTFWHWNLAFKF
jgi:hypothetical protein